MLYLAQADPPKPKYAESEQYIQYEHVARADAFIKNVS